MPEPGQTPEQALREQVAEIRDALRDLRESVVLRVMYRDKVQADATRLEQRLAELERGLSLAERAQNPGLQHEIQQEQTRVAAELERTRTQLTQAQMEAESAKIRLPEDESTLLRTINELQARYTRFTAAQVEANVSGGGGETDSLWERASGKIADLTREAQARDEVTASRGNQATTTQGTGNRVQDTVKPALDNDQNAEQMLAALEQHLGLAGASPQTPQLPPARANYLELDSPPAPESNGLTQAEPAHSSTENDTGKSDVVLPDGLPREVEADAPADEEPLLSPLEANTGNSDLPEHLNTRTPEHPKPNTQHLIRKETSRMEAAPRVRVAAIGTGNIFRGAHLPCYPDIAAAQLVALCDPDRMALDLAYKKYQGLMEAKIRQALEANDILTAERLESDLETIQLCDDISEVIEIIKPDLVDICTQPLLHTPLAIQALEAGFHVMCEKPISRSWLESQQLIQTIERTGKFYQHNENWLFEPDYYTVKKLVDAGAIGELTMMFLTQAHGGPEGNPRFWNSDFGGGGALLDNGIHAIGAAWYIAGLDKTPTLVKAAAPYGMSIRMPDRIIDGKYQHITVDDDAHILIRFEDAKTNAWTTAHVEGSWSEQDSPDTAYIGTTGSIKMVQEDGKRYAVVCDIKGQETRRFRASGSNWQHWPSSFYGEIQNMVQCILNNQQSIMTAQFGADCSAIVGASYLSEKSGKKAVSLDEFRRFALDIADRYPNDPTGANNALVDELLSAVRDKTR